ncbi:potassium transporter KimA [Bacillus subtilis]|uniref:potassium transporter KimA n=1 Tax=Bacillus TaxID=1386 RepID=UPI0018CF3885|nr:potassium transporter KimA [Bacillus subtilis]MBG9457507.1 amino acid permease [Bacillus subtilis]MBG9487878.1 amino acid permease [Bacillus subtilis]MBG9569775.1 amino acid permease [Bacillus subtilis]MBR9951524.1 potassium transporter KimA [Bacillus subtilis]UML53355.1 potassium transporter KimA [Bacillus subtilis]
MYHSIKRFLIGKPLKSQAAGEQKLTKLKALAMLSSDALSSVAYGTEQILIILATISAAAFWYSIPIAVGVLILLLALILSYRQIIYAYPQGGGAYIVSKENLGEKPGLIAGGSLLVDYILTVAVSISAGTDAITSAFPALHDYHVPIAIFLVLVIMILNLRGLSESASILAYPVYLFVVALLILIAVGLFKLMTGQIDQPAHHTPLGTPVAGITLFLLLKAFSSGCSALTGVEAISNAIPAFKNPPARNAARTLAMMGILLAILFSGITVLAYGYGTAPKPDETVVSQIASETFGRNVFYYVIQGVTSLILVLAANTGFSAFPQLAFNLARDQYMPRMFTVRGDRLGFSNGIIFLGFASIVLIILFGGQTEHLIPLYAVGVFIPFTLSQTGMCMKWIKQKPKGWIGKMLINSCGALISFMVLSILFVTKFNVVWPVLIFMPIVVLLFFAIKNHYTAVGEQLRIVDKEPEEIKGTVVIVPVAGVTTVVQKSIHYAKSLSDQVIAVHVSFDREQEKKFEKRWEELNNGVRLVTLHSSYRSLVHPFDKFLETVEAKAKKEQFSVMVLFPQFITKKRWHTILHNQSAFLLRVRLFWKKDIMVATLPYHFKK